MQVSGIVPKYEGLDLIFNCTSCSVAEVKIVIPVNDFEM